MTKNAKPGPSAPLPEIDWVSYGRCPNLPLSSLTALGRQLLTAVPARMTAALTGSREQLQFELARAEAGYTEHLLVPDPQSKRPIDMAADISWGALHGRMESLAMLPHDRYPSAARAATLRDLLFPQGLTFLTLEYGAQWAEAERRLKVIEQQRLKSEIDALCGPEVLVEVRRCHAEYAEMIGVTKAKGAKFKLPDLRALRLSLQHAISAHMMQLLAYALAGGAAGLEAITPALEAMDAYREKAQSTPPEKPEPPKGPTPAPTP